MNGRGTTGQDPNVIERLIASYDQAFRRTMTVTPAEAGQGEALARALGAVGGPAADLALTLLIGVGAGEMVPPRLLGQVERWGEPLWRMALLLPRATPSPGATIDPRYYAADCKINPALASVRLLPELVQERELAAHRPPSDALWDATVVAAHLEVSPATLTRDGKVRKDVERRVLRELGEDTARWSLALAMARTTGLVREAAGRLYGRPESFPRRLPLLEPSHLLEGDAAVAGNALLRVLSTGWVDFAGLMETLERRAPYLICEHRDQPWRSREEPAFRAAATALHRAGVIDASLSSDGIVALRLAHPRPPRPQGFILTPDREILVAPGELPGPEYGRLCRVAPYVDGDVVHRHRLTREGVAADIAAGYDDLGPWLASRSRTGLPSGVRMLIDEWAASAVRITLFTGVSVLEQDGRFTVLGEGGIPARARLLYYDEPPPARFFVADGVICVPFGEDALTVRAAVARLGTPLPPADRCHRYQIQPEPVTDPERVLDQLRRYHLGALPAELEAMVHAAGGRRACWLEEAVVLHLPPEAADALRRDRLVGGLLGRDLGGGQSVVDRIHLDAVMKRLEALGFVLNQPPSRGKETT